MLRLLRTAADGLISLSAIIGTLGLLTEVGVILVDVVGRALGAPLYGSQDITTMAMVILVFGGMAICDRRGGHIAVDLFEPYFPDIWNRITDILAALMGAIIFVTLAWAVNESAKLSDMLNLSTNLLRLPKSWFQNALSVFALVTAAAMLLRALELAISGRDTRKEDQI